MTCNLEAVSCLCQLEQSSKQKIQYGHSEGEVENTPVRGRQGEKRESSLFFIRK